MTAAIFIMALLGCGEGEAPCQQVRVLETRYESQAACIAATEAVLTRNLDVDYPVIVVQCQKAGDAPVVLPQDVLLPVPQASRLRS